MRLLANIHFAKWTGWVSLAAVAVVVFSLALARPREPEYQGRSAWKWLGDVVFRPTRPGSFQTEALTDPIVAFRAMGTNGVAFLVKALDQREHLLNQVYRRAFSKLPLDAQYRLPLPVDFDTLANAARLVLMNLRDETSDRTFARLVRLLEADNPRTRLRAAGVVHHYASNYRNLNLVQFQPELVRALRDSNYWIRIEVAYTLMNAQLNRSELVEKLTPALTDSNATIREAARHAIERANNLWPPINYHAP